MLYLYKKYFQKSKVFLYPLLNIPKTLNYNPINTFISLGESVDYTEYKLFVLFQKENSDSYKAFEKQLFLKNPFFCNFIECEDNLILYVFDYSRYKEDWDNFLIGKYSKLNKTIKDAIKNYYGEHTDNWKCLKSYLYPSDYMMIYANLLADEKDVKEMYNILKKTEELCDKFDEEKENALNFVKIKNNLYNGCTK